MNRFSLLFLALVLACHTNNTQKELVVLDNKDSEEITFILELNTKENSLEDVESFTQYLSDFIVEREPSTVYGYYICLLYTSPSPRDYAASRMPSSA